MTPTSIGVIHTGEAPICSLDYFAACLRAYLKHLVVINTETVPKHFDLAPRTRLLLTTVITTFRPPWCSRIHASARDFSLTREELP